MNELVSAQQNAVTTFGDADPFGYQGTEGTQGTTFMKFIGQSGKYMAGQDDEEIELGSSFAIDMFNARYEWLFWWDGEVLGTVSGTIMEAPALYDQKPDYLPEDPEGKIDMTLEEIEERQADRSVNNNDGWTCSAVLGLRGLDGSFGEDSISGEEFTLKLNQGVAMRSFHGLRKSFGRRYKTKTGLLPVIEIDNDSYTPRDKQAGKKRYAPVLKIVDWKSEDELQDMIGEGPSGYDDDGGAESSAPQVEDHTANNSEAPADEDKPRARGRRRGGNF